MRQKPNGRKIVISVLLTRDEIAYLDRKVRQGVDGRESRSALIRVLVRKSMQENLL